MRDEGSHIGMGFVYAQLGVHVSTDDAELMEALDDFAARFVVGGVSAVSDEHREQVRAAHRDAGNVYAAVALGGVA